MKKILFLIIVSCVVSCMDKFDNQELYFTNNSENSVYTILTYKELIYSNASIGVSRSDSILSNVKYKLDRPGDWDGYLKMTSTGKLNMYVIEKDSVAKYGWKEIHAKNIYNKKYMFDMDDLDRLNWTIEYTGN